MMQTAEVLTKVRPGNFVIYRRELREIAEVTAGFQRNVLDVIDMGSPHYALCGPGAGRLRLVGDTEWALMDEMEPAE